MIFQYISRSRFRRILPLILSVLGIVWFASARFRSEPTLREVEVGAIWREEPGSPSKNEIESPLDRYVRDPRRNNGEMVNRHAFGFVLNPAQGICPGNADIFLLIYVHSDVKNVNSRLTIRNTWGGVRQFDAVVKLIFVVGMTSDQSDSAQIDLKEENERYGDVVQANFTDAYRSINRKAIPALKWVSEYCPRASYFLKADDDVVVDVFHLLKHLKRFPPEEKTLLCHVMTKPEVRRSGKWRVDVPEFGYDYYPDFCDGAAYVLSRAMVKPLYNASHYVPLLWIDDVYVTGFLPLRIDNVRRFHVNRFCVNVNDYWQYTLHRIFGWDVLCWAHVKDAELFESLWRRFLSQHK